DDAVVGRDQVLLGAIDDRPHAFLQRAVLDGDPLDAAVAVTALLRGAIHQVVVVLVGERPIRSRHVLAVHALAVQHRLALGGGDVAGGMVVVAPGPAVFVVDRTPEVAVHRMAAARRDHGEGRHHPLRDAPVVVVVLGIAAGADVEAAGTLDHLEYGARVAEIVLIALGALEQRVGADVGA